tara:strand:- start:200 stop:433 length:234 start_codon:yes stop_codon:yes gene_type:complete
MIPIQINHKDINSKNMYSGNLNAWHYGMCNEEKYKLQKQFDLVGKQAQSDYKPNITIINDNDLIAKYFKNIKRCINN